MSIMIQPTSSPLGEYSCWLARKASADVSRLSGYVRRFGPFIAGSITAGTTELHEKASFLAKFVQSPGRIGSITPSSSFLAEAMVRPINWAEARSIVELGAGTGVFTSYINRLKHPDCQAFIFEQENEMRRRLMSIYQDMNHHSRAEDLFHVIHEAGIHEVDCILSGLPFANFPQALRDDILDTVVSTLKPGGVFVAFQYSLQMKDQFIERFSRVDLSFVPFNVPPAFVYYCYT